MKNGNIVDFVIIGAQKAGTSNFRRLILQHPNIHCLNEVNFFSNDKEFGKGYSYYENKFLHLNQFDGIIGDKSPNTYAHPNAFDRIHNWDPGAKIIFILREPINRAYSDYWFSVYRGREKRSFEDAINLELKGLQNNRFRRYLERSSYILYLNRLETLFGRKQVHLVLFEEMKSNPQKVANEAFRFLQLPEKMLVEKKVNKNPTYMPRNVLINYWANHLFATSKLRILYDLVRRFNRNKEPGYPPMDDKIYLILKNFFQPLNQELELKYNLNISLW